MRRSIKVGELFFRVLELEGRKGQELIAFEGWRIPTMCSTFRKENDYIRGHVRSLHKVQTDVE